MDDINSAAAAALTPAMDTNVNSHGTIKIENVRFYGSVIPTMFLPPTN